MTLNTSCMLLMYGCGTWAIGSHFDPARIPLHITGVPHLSLALFPGGKPVPVTLITPPHKTLLVEQALSPLSNKLSFTPVSRIRVIISGALRFHHRTSTIGWVSIGTSRIRELWQSAGEFWRGAVSEGRGSLRDWRVGCRLVLLDRHIRVWS